MSDERHQTWNLWAAYGGVFVVLPLVVAWLIYGVQVGHDLVVVAAPETCHRALAERASRDLQGYELRACRAAGVDLEAADARLTARHARRLSAAEDAAQREARTDAVRRSLGRVPPYDRARFCATPGLTCLD